MRIVQMSSCSDQLQAFNVDMMESKGGSLESWRCSSSSKLCPSREKKLQLVTGYGRRGHSVNRYFTVGHLSLRQGVLVPGLLSKARRSGVITNNCTVERLKESVMWDKVYLIILNDFSSLGYILHYGHFRPSQPHSLRFQIIWVASTRG